MLEDTEILEAIASAHNSLAQAIGNLVADVHHPATNPHGNIDPDLVTAVNEALADIRPTLKTLSSQSDGAEAEEARKALVDAVHTCNCARKWELRTRKWSPDGSLHRFISKESFAYHLAGDEPSRLADVSDYLDALFDDAAAPKPTHIPRARLAGTTARPGYPAWWTFQLPEDKFTSGREYAGALALGITAEEGLIEVRMGHTRFGAKGFCKPCAIDGFCANTLFRPNHDAVRHGRTAPTDPEVAGQPELVRPPDRYHALLGDGDSLEIRYHAW